MSQHRSLTKKLLVSTIILTSLGGLGIQSMSSAIHADNNSVININQDSSSNSSSQSSEKTDAIQKKALTKTYVSIGSGVQDTNKIKQVLGAEDGDVVFTTDGSQLDQYLQIPGIVDSQVKSSVRISPAEEGTGTRVNIVDYDGKNNITTITSQQYAMAATVAGINDVIITVSSPSPVDGSGALAGVYQAIAKNGTNLDTRNTTAANQLLDSTKQAVDANKNDKTYPGKLTSAVVNTAGDISKTEMNGNTVNINQIFNDNLKDAGIATATTIAQRQPIVQALQLVSQAPVSKTSQFSNQASKAAKLLDGMQGNIMAQASDFADAGALDKIEGFFNKTITEIRNSLGNFGDWARSKFDAGRGVEPSNKSSNESSSASSPKLKDDANNITSDGSSNSSRLLQLFKQWDGTKDGSIIELNNNHSQFTDKILNQKFLTNGHPTALNPLNGLQLSALDSLGRSQEGNAYITKESMSGTGRRIPIPAISAPSGWYKGAIYNQSKNMWTNQSGDGQGGLDSNNMRIEGGWLYNRSHIIGYQFFDNNNKATNGDGDISSVMSINNLTTGTRVENADPGQLKYENLVADAVKNGGHEVRYRVVPIYQGTELVPRMVHMEGKSVDDNGQSVDFNVVVLNVQPGYKINYATGEASKD